MIIGSIKENLTVEKRVSITPDTAKNIINLGLKVIIENNYANHIGIVDKEYDPAYPVVAGLDIGFDGTAIWYLQNIALSLKNTTARKNYTFFCRKIDASSDRASY